MDAEIPWKSNSATDEITTEVQETTPLPELRPNPYSKRTPTSKTTNTASALNGVSVAVASTNNTPLIAPINNVASSLNAPASMTGGIVQPNKSITVQLIPLIFKSVSTWQDRVYAMKTIQYGIDKGLFRLAQDDFILQALSFLSKVALEYKKLTPAIRTTVMQKILEHLKTNDIPFDKTTLRLIA
jgi:hypothetical protein